MLVQLTIQNLALIAYTEIKFQPGFTAITGETGAGKSVFLNGLRLVCGAKATAQMVRHGESKASVEAIFNISQLPEVHTLLDNLGIDSEDHELVIQREILATGKSRARINGSLINQSDLQELGELLVQMHGQSEQILLRDPRTQLRLLDDFCDNATVLESYSALWSDYTRLRQSMNDAKTKAAQLAQQKEFLQFQFEELRKAALRPGEEDELERITEEASGGESKMRLVEESMRILEREHGLLDQIQELQIKLRQLHVRHPEVDALEHTLSEAMDPIQAVQNSLQRLEKGHSYSPHELEKANARLPKIQKLKRKYRTDLTGLIALEAQRRQELDSLENLDADLADLEHKANKVHGELLGVASQLTTRRTEGAQKLDSWVEAKLQTLGMAQARFATRTLPGDLGPHGAETIEFTMAPNTGEGMKPLRLSISGGELSRVLLAFKSVLAHRDHIPLLIFDEVDSGISGEIAHSIGDCLHDLGQYHQVLTITHLHQVASRATSQFKVQKSEHQGRTLTDVKPLEGETRIREIARMLGDEQAPTVVAHARQLLELAYAH